MSHIYVEDLFTEIILKLSLSDIKFLLPKETWGKKFVASFGVSLPIGADYELYYTLFYTCFEQRDYKHAISVAVVHGYNLILSFFAEKLLCDLTVPPNKLRRIYIDANFLAAKYDNLEALVIISDYRFCNPNPDSLFTDAVNNSSYNVMKFLLDKGVDITGYTWEGLRLAAQKNDVVLIDFLIAKGANIHSLEVHLFSLIELVKRTTILHLISLGLDLNQSKAMEAAIYHGKVDIIKFLVENGAEITLEVLKHYSNGKIEVLEFLVPRFANVNDFDDYLLHKACIIGNVDIVTFLLSNGIENRALPTAIKWARFYKNTAIKELIEQYLVLLNK